MIHMKLQLPYLVNIPPFMLKGLEKVEISFPKKFYLIIKGKLVSLIIKVTNGKLFCFLLNLLFYQILHFLNLNIHNKLLY